MNASAKSMIDAQAVLADLDTLRTLSSNGGDHQSRGLSWAAQQLQISAIKQTTDAAGNTWFTLPGDRERSVVVGCALGSASAQEGLDSRLGVAVGIETLKALAQRFPGKPPCTVQLVLWAKPTEQPIAQAVAAYLELHVEPAQTLEIAGTPLGVVAAAREPGAPAFHPRLMALCDEAIRELTGTSASLPAGPAPHAAAMAQQGIPTALMYVQALEGSADTKAMRLHVQQAAEAFGRWTEATVHLVAGDEVDLWAREHRVPHSS